MGRVLTNATTLQMAEETVTDTQPTTGWKVWEPNSIGKFGPTLTKLTREPISKNRQRRKGALTDLDSSVEFDADLTYDHAKMIAQGLFFSTFKGIADISVSAVSATGYTVVGAPILPDDVLVYASGFANPANNGLKVLTGTSTAIELKTPGLVVENPAPAGARIQVAGIKGATADVTINAGGNLQTTALNWTTHAVGSLLQIGQFIWVGYTVGHANSFSNAANRGFARVVNKTATTLTLDKKSSTFVADTGSGKNIYVLFGNFVRNVPVGDPDYVEKKYWFELGYENLGSAGADKYEYAETNFVNEVSFDLAVASKATMKCSFVGLDCANPTLTRATGASSATPIVAANMFNTSVDLMRLRVTQYDETGITTDFKSLNIVIRNNVTPEKVLGNIGGKYINAGLFDIEISGQALFTDSGVLEAMRSNATVTMEAAIRNDDGGIMFDFPAMTVEGGDKEFPVNQTVAVAMKNVPFQDPRLGYTASMSFFPHLPSE